MSGMGGFSHSMGGANGFSHGMGNSGINFGSSARSFNMGPSISSNGRQFSSGNLRGMSGSNFDRSGIGRDFNGSDFARGNISRGNSFGNWTHNANWDRGEHFANFHNGQFNNNFHNGNFNNFHDGFNHFHNRNNFWWGAPFWWWPAWTWGWGWGWGGWGGGYGYDWPYCYYDTPLYSSVGYDSGAIAAAPYANDAIVADTTSANSQYSDSDLSSTSGAAYFGEAENAFHAGQYRDAARLANHAAVESPQNPKGPELMSLAMFAAADYRAAAAQAHAALSLGPVPEWATIYGYYGDVGKYTEQLRALEKYVDQNPKAPEAHFLLAYHYLATGYAKDAMGHLQEVAKLAPNDKLTGELVKKYGGGEAPAALPVPPQPAPAAQ
jgi:tetratricopeptide (TPR) repeat protein